MGADGARRSGADPFPFGSIPTSRVTYLGNTGESTTSIGTGVATTILFGGIGLLGFLAKNHNYNYFINGEETLRCNRLSIAVLR
jgi:hypothetical protein